MSLRRYDVESDSQSRSLLGRDMEAQIYSEEGETIYDSTLREKREVS